MEFDDEEENLSEPEDEEDEPGRTIQREEDKLRRELGFFDRPLLPAGVFGDAKGRGEETPAPKTTAARTQAKSALLRDSQARRLKFQGDALKALGVPENTKRITTTLPGGGTITAIPDGLHGETIIEAKDVTNLSMSRQFRGYDATRRPVILAASPNTRSISEQVEKFVDASRGKIEVFDPKTGICSAWNKN
jgi:hypothetical protein